MEDVSHTHNMNDVKATPICIANMKATLAQPKQNALRYSSSNYWPVRVSLIGVTLSEVTLSKVTLSEVTLLEVTLSEVTLSEVTLSEVTLLKIGAY